MVKQVIISKILLDIYNIQVFRHTHENAWKLLRCYAVVYYICHLFFFIICIYIFLLLLHLSCTNKIDGCFLRCLCYIFFPWFYRYHCCCWRQQNEPSILQLPFPISRIFVDLFFFLFENFTSHKKIMLV